MKFASHYNPPPSVGVAFEGESLTQQEYKDDCDVNVMIRRAVAGDTTVFRHPVYADVVGAPDSAHDVANRLAQANTIWHDLPERVRQTYGSPEAMLKAIDEAESANKAVEAAKAAQSLSAPAGAEPSTGEPAPSST